MSIVNTVNEIYTPVFDENTNTYKDQSPYKNYERNRIHYSCPCKAGVIFSSNHLFKQHIKTKTHIEYLKNFMIYNKPLIDERELTKRLKYNNEMLFRKNGKMLKALQILEPQVKNLNLKCAEKETIIQDQLQSIVNQQLRITNMKTKFEELLKEKETNIERLNSIIDEINKYDYKLGDFENEDSTLFHDCEI